MTRYGIIEFSPKALAEFLGLDKPIRPTVHRVIEDLPDDIEIVGAEFDSINQRIRIVVRGSGSPLYKIGEGGVIPNIDITWEEVDKLK